MSRSKVAQAFLKALYPPEASRVLMAMADVMTSSAAFDPEARKLALQRYAEEKAEYDRLHPGVDE